MNNHSTLLDIQKEDRAIGVNELGIEVNLLNKSARVLRAITHKLRCDLLRLIHQEEVINVTDIYSKMGLEQTVASQHLSILREAGFVVTQREGKCIYYSINYKRLSQANALSMGLIDK